ncbi:MAG: DUF4157 domain-containing protein [Cyanobacteria bacterium J06627_28]
MRSPIPTKSQPQQSFTPTYSGLLRCKYANDKSADLAKRPLTPPIMHEVLRSPTPKIQHKLKIGAPNDKYEQEADRVANEVVKMPDSGVVKALSSALPTRTALSSVQRVCEKCKEEEESLQTKRATGITSKLTPDIETEIQSIRGGGQPLSLSERGFFEPRFGHDFGQVRIHRDARAAALVDSLKAKAFAVGPDIVLGIGQYKPQTTDGRRLLAHELTHVVQQQGATVAEPVIQKFSPRDYIPEGLTSASETAVQYAIEALGVLEEATIISSIEAALRMPVIGSSILDHPALAGHRQTIEFIQATPGALEVIWDFIQNPEPYTKHIKESLEPYIKESQQLAVHQGGKLLEDLGIPAEYQASVWQTLKYISGFARSAFDFVIDDVILDTVLFWQLRSEQKIYDGAWSNYKTGKIDAYDLIAEHLSIVFNVIGRVGDLMPLVLSAAGLVSGGAIGGTAGSVVPGAGTAAGAGSASSAGGASGLAVSEVIGLVALLGPAGLEFHKALKAALELALKEQNEKQRQQDFGQIATSAFSLIIMAMLAFLPGLAMRLGRKLARKLATLIPDTHHLLPSVEVKALEGSRTIETTPVEVNEINRVSTNSTNIEDSVARSSRRENTQITEQEAIKEVAYINAHPELITGTPPNRKAKIGEHEISRLPNGGCVRRSKGKKDVPCPELLEAQSLPSTRQLPTVELKEQLSASGFESSLAASGGGVYIATSQHHDLPKRFALKVYPASDERLQQMFLREMAAAQAVSRIPGGPQFYGQVNVPDGRLGFAMEIVPGGFPDVIDTPKNPVKANKEAVSAQSAISDQTLRDIADYGEALLEAGFYYRGEMQGLIDARGRYRPIDFQGIEKLPDDPIEQTKAIHRHLEWIRDEVGRHRKYLKK